MDVNDRKLHDDLKGVNIDEQECDNYDDAKLGEIARVESSNDKGAGKKQATDNTYTKNKQINSVGWNSALIGIEIM